MQILTNVYVYGKCPKILYTKVPNKMACANSSDLEQTATADQDLHCLPFYLVF